MTTVQTHTFHQSFHSTQRYSTKARGRHPRALAVVSKLTHTLSLMCSPHSPPGFRYRSLSAGLENGRGGVDSDESLPRRAKQSRMIGTVLDCGCPADPRIPASDRAPSDGSTGLHRRRRFYRSRGVPSEVAGANRHGLAVFACKLLMYRSSAARVWRFVSSGCRPPSRNRAEELCASAVSSLPRPKGEMATIRPSG